MNKERNIGFISLISFIIGLALLIGFVFTGYSSLLISIVFLVLSFILSLLSKNDKFGRISLFALPVLLVLYVLFFIIMSSFWN